LKWAACALASREKTSALRQLLGAISAFFERLHELNYKLDDKEASVLLPHLLDNAWKPAYQDQSLNILSYLRSNDIYPTRQYGSLTCVKVLEKSSTSKARLLAACQIEECVQTTGLAAIGKAGLRVLGKALSTEKLIENRVAYLNLFQAILSKLNGDIPKLFSLCDTLSENAKEMIQQKCSKRSELPSQNSLTSQSPRLLTPSRSSTGGLRGLSPRVDLPKPNSSRLSQSSPRIESSVDQNNTTKLAKSSSAIARSQLNQRFQRSVQSKNTLPLPSSSAGQQPQSPSPQVHLPSTTPKVIRDIQQIMEERVDNNSVESGLVITLEGFIDAITHDAYALEAEYYNDHVKSISG
jgi:hypothetical protein